MRNDEKLYIAQMPEGRRVPGIQRVAGGSPSAFPTDRVTCHFSYRAVTWLSNYADGRHDSWPSEGADTTLLDFGPRRISQGGVRGDNCSTPRQLELSAHKGMAEMTDEHILA